MRYLACVFQCLSAKRPLFLAKRALLVVILLLLVYQLLFNLLSWSPSIHHDGGGGTQYQPLKSFNTTITQISTKTTRVESKSVQSLSPNITIAITICGNNSLIQGMVALKSALLLTQQQLHLIILTDRHLFKSITYELQNLKIYSFTYELHTVRYPDPSMTTVWRKLFKECASQRLFLPWLFPQIDSLLYIDTDVLFLSPVEQLWENFFLMNSSHIAAMTYESEDFSSSWYHRFAKHPYYGPYGINSGVMLMNLTRMRHFGWIEKLQPILLKYKSQIVWGDQDIINVIFNQYPEKLYLLDCNWNYRSDHCIYSTVCKAADKEGIKVVHGNRGAFLLNKYPEFRALFQAFALFNETTALETRLRLSTVIHTTLDSQSKKSNCAKISHHLWEAIERVEQLSFVH